MANRKQLAVLREAWTWGDDAYEDLADELYTFKVAAYEDTLLALAERHGYRLDLNDQGELDLPQSVLDSLAGDAEAAARQIVVTHNRDVNRLIDRHDDMDVIDLQELLEDWEADRATTKAEQVGKHEVYGPHGDATVAFYKLAGLDPEFDFGGHGDAAPKCELCAALLDSNPHPLERVLRIGTPHHGCAQNWHARVGDTDLPDDLDLGDLVVQGIGGGETLLQRAGSLEAAIAMVRGE